MPEPAAPIRLIALDLDGTLLGADDAVSPANVAAVRRARERGIRIVLATSRWFPLARRTADELGLTAPLICHNGALVKSPVDGQELLRLEIPPGPALEVAAFADAAGYTTMTSVGDVTYLRSRQPVEPDKLYPGVRLVERHAPLVESGAIAFIVFGEEGVEAALAAFAKKYRGVLNLARGESETFPPYLAIGHAAADKGRSLALVCGHLGIDPRETMAIGDAGPDVSMLRTAGLAVAMGNALPEVKTAANLVAPPNTRDGVAWAIERCVLS